MAEHLNLYQQARYYDVIFDRDVSREVDFIFAAYRHYTGGELTSMLDIACGPGYHARAFTRRGVRAVGLDLRPEMIDFAHEKDVAAGVSITLIPADMRDFELDTAVDVALAAFDGLDALLSNEDLIRHFRTVARNLTPGGLYIVDLTHPRDCSYEHYGAFHYSGERDGIKVDIDWATNNPHYDLITSIAYVELQMHIQDHGQEYLVQDAARERLLLPQEIHLLAELSGGLKVVGWHGDFDLNQPLDNSPASRRMIAILQRRESAVLA